MSRIRYIKPGFFVDDDLAQCQPLARILFAGLWTIADREGRLEDRPRRIRAEILPNEDVNTDALLQELADHGQLIVRYEVDGQRYIAIPGFLKHQKPHSRELPSVIPEPSEHDLGSAQEQPRQCPSTTQARRDLDLDGDLDLDLDGKEPMPNSDESGVSDFAAFWSNYPRKVGSTAAKKRWKHLGVADRRAATLAAGHYAEYVRQTATELQFVPHPATFLGPKRSWEDWTAGPPPGYSGGNGDGTVVVKRPTCPKCEADLTVDEDGEHCPVCPWRSSPELTIPALRDLERELARSATPEQEPTP